MIILEKYHDKLVVVNEVVATCQIIDLIKFNRCFQKCTICFQQPNAFIYTPYNGLRASLYRRLKGFIGT